MNGDRQRDMDDLLILGYSSVVTRTFLYDERGVRVELEEEMMNNVKNDAGKMRRKIVG